MLYSDAGDLFQALEDAGMSRADIEEYVKKKTNETGGFMTPETILLFLAKERGIKVRSSGIDPGVYDEIDDGIDYDDFRISIKKVKEGMNNIVILGRIEQIFKAREFSRKDGTKGKVGSFVLNDGTARIKVVLWDDQTLVMLSNYFKVNELLRVIGGFSKEDINGRVEVHLSKKGKVELAPDSALSKTIPLISDAPIDSTSYNELSISQLHDKEGFIPLVQGIVHIENFEERNLKSGDKSFILKFSLSDESSSIKAVAWGMNAVNFLKSMNDGDAIRLGNVTMKFNSYSGSKEIRLTKGTTLEIMN